MAKPDKAELTKQGVVLKEVIAKARKKPYNFALLQGKDQMYLVTHLKKKPEMLRKEAKKEGGGPKGIMGTLNVEGKNLIFSIEEEPPGSFPKLIKNFFMVRGIAVSVTFNLASGPEEESGGDVEAEADVQAVAAPPADAPAQQDESAVEEEPAAEEKAEDEGYFASIAGVFSDLRADLSKKIDGAADEIKNEYHDLIDKIDKSIVGKKRDEARDSLKKLQTLHDKYIKPVTEKAAEYYEEIKTRSAAKERMEALDLSDVQTEQLSDLAVVSPKVFEATVKTLASMDAKFGDLDATPGGIVALEKNASDAEKLWQAANNKFREMWKNDSAARIKVEAAEKKIADIKKRAEAFEAALVKLRNSLPKDITEMTDAQKKVLAKLLNALKTSKTALVAATVDLTQEKSAKQLAQIAYDASEKTNNELSAAFNKQDDIAKAAATKKKMLDSMAVGALSPNSKDPLNEDEVAQILSAIEASTEFGDSALDLLETTKDKSHIAKGAGMLATGISNEFKDQDGNPYGDENARQEYASSALKLGNALGGTYFDDMNAYIKKGGMNETPKLSFDYGSEKERDQNRAKFVSGSMLDSNGKIDTKSAAATAALDEINFHPDAMYPETPGMNMHFADMVKTMEDPAHKDKMQNVLDGVTTKPKTKTGLDLVAQATGKPAADLKPEDTKAAIMSAMFTPLNQGPVGSCFATGPARNLRGKDPAKAMAGMAEIATKGTFTTEQGVPIKAVRANIGTSEADQKKHKLPEDDNPLMRSWEYTIATAGAMLKGSYEEEQLDKQLWATNLKRAPNGDNLNELEYLTGMTDWENVKERLKKAIHDELDFRYNATSKIKDSSDGSSTRGNFEIVNKSNHPPKGPIVKKADFIAIISALAIEAAKAKNNPALSQLITDHCSSQAFIDSVCLWKKGGAGKEDDIRLPWEISGGGIEGNMIKVLEGKLPDGSERLTRDISGLSANPKVGKRGRLDKGARTKKVVSKLIESYMKQGPDVEMTNISTGGIHAFTGLPNHPSLDVLKEGSDPAAAMEEHMLKPGREMAAKEMDVRTVTMLFDRQITAFGELHMPKGLLEDDKKGVELIAEARKKRPNKGMKPKEIKALIDELAKPINAYTSNANVESWKASETANGKAPDAKAFARQLEAYEKFAESKKEQEFDNNIINTLDPPEFVIADTNWGDGDGHSFFVIIPDPVTGDPKMFKRDEPSGKLSAMSKKWTDTSWEETK